MDSFESATEQDSDSEKHDDAEFQDVEFRDVESGDIELKEVPLKVANKLDEVDKTNPLANLILPTNYKPSDSVVAKSDIFLNPILNNAEPSQKHSVIRFSNATTSDSINISIMADDTMKGRSRSKSKSLKNKHDSTNPDKTGGKSTTTLVDNHDHMEMDTTKDDAEFHYIESYDDVLSNVRQEFESNAMMAFGENRMSIMDNMSEILLLQSELSTQHFTLENKSSELFHSTLPRFTSMTSENVSELYHNNQENYDSLLFKLDELNESINSMHDKLQKNEKRKS